MSNDAKIIFFGTPDFAVPALEALVGAGFSVAAVVTNPDEPAGRKQILTPPPVKIAAEKHGIPVLQPEKLEPQFFQKDAPEADLFAVAAYGKIIPKSILEIPKRGAINIHPSLLPRWRGASPIQYTILSGDEKAGVTVMLIDELMDHGPILAQQELANYKPQYTNYKTLHDESAKLGARLLAETLPKFLSGEIKPVPQEDAKATFSKILKKDDGRADWKKPAGEIARMVRALTPWPGVWTVWPRDGKIFRVRIEEAEALPLEPAQGSPGFVWQNRDEPLLVKTGRGSLAVKTLTLQGKKSLTSAEFLRGHPEIIGASFV